MRSRLYRVIGNLSPRHPRHPTARVALLNVSAGVNHHLPSPRHLRTTSRAWRDVGLTELRNQEPEDRKGDWTKTKKVAVLPDEDFAFLLHLYLETVQQFASMAETLRKISENRERDNIETAQILGKPVEFATEFTADRLIISTPGVGPYVLEVSIPGQQVLLSSPSSSTRCFSYVTCFSEKENWGGKVLDEDCDEEEDCEYEVCNDGDSKIVGNGKRLDITDGTNLAVLLNSELGLEIPVVFEPMELQCIQDWRGSGLY